MPARLEKTGRNRRASKPIMFDLAENDRATGLRLTQLIFDGQQHGNTNPSIARLPSACKSSRSSIPRLTDPVTPKPTRRGPKPIDIRPQYNSAKPTQRLSIKGSAGLTHNPVGAKPACLSEELTSGLSRTADGVPWLRTRIIGGWLAQTDA
jgi:hypothetical protein